MDLPVSPEAQILTGTVSFNAIGQIKPIKDAPFFVRSFLLQPGESNTGIVRMGFGAGAARQLAVPISFASVLEGKTYDLNKVIVEAATVAADTVTWAAVR